MNDSEIALFGWRMRLTEVDSIICTLDKKKEEIETMINFWQERVQEEKSQSNEKTKKC